GRKRKYVLKNGDFLIASKMRSIHFNIFSLATPTMIHRAPFCATFLRKKVAKRMFHKRKKTCVVTGDVGGENIQS
ncbi:MAG: hypothetical protein IKZ11_00960, partial [Alistipes sp.]|nr:hypothetical protein [Alistipes sp.]